jgi:hypothetical protein
MDVWMQVVAWPWLFSKVVYMMKELDRLDDALRDGAFQHPGICIQQLIEPFLLEKSEFALRRRVKLLQLQGFLRFERTKSEIKVYPAEA